MKRLLLVVLLIAAFQVSAQQSDRVVRASAFILEDEQGEKRAVLRLATKHTPELVLYDENGNSRISFLMIADETWLKLEDGKGKRSITLSAGRHETALQIFDEKDKVRADIGVGENNWPMLRLFDGNGKVRLVLIVGDEGPGLVLTDENGKLKFFSTP